MSSPVELFYQKLATNHALHLSNHIADNGHGNNKKKLLGIIVGIIIFGLTTCVCITILKRQGKLCPRYCLTSNPICNMRLAAKKKKVQPLLWFLYTNIVLPIRGSENNLQETLHK